MLYNFKKIGRQAIFKKKKSIFVQINKKFKQIEYLLTFNLDN